jgi:hypothetical protein
MLEECSEHSGHTCSANKCTCVLMLIHYTYPMPPSRQLSERPRFADGASDSEVSVYVCVCVCVSYFCCNDDLFYTASYKHTLHSQTYTHTHTPQQHSSTHVHVHVHTRPLTSFVASLCFSCLLTHTFQSSTVPWSVFTSPTRALSRWRLCETEKMYACI